MPSGETLDNARPHCPGTSTNVRIKTKNHGLGKGENVHEVHQHLPCGVAMTWSHPAGGWECPDHGFLLSGAQAAALLFGELEELPAVEAA